MIVDEGVEHVPYTTPASYRRLLAAVLIQAINDYEVIHKVEELNEKDSRYELVEPNETKWWFDVDNESEEPWSFIWVCECLGLDVYVVRNQVLRNPTSIRRSCERFAS